MRADLRSEQVFYIIQKPFCFRIGIPGVISLINRNDKLGTHHGFYKVRNIRSDRLSHHSVIASVKNDTSIPFFHNPVGVISGSLRTDTCIYELIGRQLIPADLPAYSSSR